jgi:hypothetical protein
MNKTTRNFLVGAAVVIVVLLVLFLMGMFAGASLLNNI